MRIILASLTCLLLAPLSSLHAAEPLSAVPQSVTELWADFDPRKDPLETEVIREWKSDGVAYRSVRFLVGTFKGKPARMAAIYAFPEGTTKPLPAILHIHGGGGRASISEGATVLAKRGYAVISVNWGGAKRAKQINAVETAQPGDPNTDWGAVDPSQLNQGRMCSMLPGPKQLFEDREHPKNANWYLVTLACRRGLTFLEQQREVDPNRLGVYGYSMGGNLTMYVAGSDLRVKAAVPAVGGSGWRNEPHPFLGGNDQPAASQGDPNLYSRTLDFQNYAPLIRCPLLHRSASDDFHGWMDDVYRTDALIQGQTVRHSFSTHLDHQLRPETAVTMPLFFDQYLKGGPALPETPASALTLKTDDGIPVMEVTPTKSAWPIAHCEIYYSVDPDPRVRFWRSTDTVRKGNVFQAKLPLHSLDLPLFVFANVYYTLPKPEAPDGLMAVQATGEIREVCLSTDLHKAAPNELHAAGVRVTGQNSSLIEDFAPGWQRDWLDYRTNGWANSTRKITDPKWRGAEGSKLALTLNLPETNRIAFEVTENEWRKYRGPKKTFVCEKEVPGATGSQTLLLDVSDFKNTDDGTPLKTWSQIDLLGIGNHFSVLGEPKDAKPARWEGPPPMLIRLEWK